MSNRHHHSVFQQPQSEFWHWPDHVIGKRESRRLREEHNKVLNELHRLREENNSLKAFMIGNCKPK